MRSEAGPVEGTIQSPDGVPIWTRRWQPARPPRGHVVLVHGLKDHSARYATLAAALNEAGLSVYGFDLRGHGRSGGPRAHVARFDEYLADLGRFVRQVRTEQPTGPLFLFGHSMGGAIAVGFVLAGGERFDGLILSGAAVAPPPTIGAGARTVTRLLSVLAPTARVFDLPDGAFSRDATTVEELRVDPLVFHGKATARLAAELLRRMARSRPELDRLELPVLVLHGSADRLTNPAGSQLLFDQSRSRDKRIKIYPGWFHDLLHEPGRQEVVNDIVQWLAIRLPDA